MPQVGLVGHGWMVDCLAFAWGGFGWMDLHAHTLCHHDPLPHTPFYPFTYACLPLVPACRRWDPSTCTWPVPASLHAFCPAHLLLCVLHHTAFSFACATHLLPPPTPPFLPSYHPAHPILFTLHTFCLPPCRQHGAETGILMPLLPPPHLPPPPHFPTTTPSHPSPLPPSHP